MKRLLLGVVLGVIAGGEGKPLAADGAIAGTAAGIGAWIEGESHWYLVAGAMLLITLRIAHVLLRVWIDLRELRPPPGKGKEAP